MLKKTANMDPFFTSETGFRQDVGKFVFGVNVFDLDFGVQKILSHNLSSSTLWFNMSHRRTSAFNNQDIHCFIVFNVFIFFEEEEDEKRQGIEARVLRLK